MTPELFWAIIALLAIAGWTATNALLSRALLPMANALGALNKVDTLFDERVMTVLSRITERKDRATPKIPGQPQQPENAAQAELHRMFGGPPIEPIPEQPDAGLEIVS